VPAPGDRVILLGGRTGRDGCGGATGSSRAHDEQSIARCGSEVQKGNAPTERKIQRLFRDPEVTRLIKRCNDFGAGGVSVAIGELADGLQIDLDRVPRKYEGLDGTELAISESQERMAVVVAPADDDRFIAAADRENLEAVVVASVTQEPRMVMTWRGKTIVDLSRSFIDTNGAPQQTDIHVTVPPGGENWFEQTATVQAGKAGFAAALTAGLSSLSGCSRRGLAERFDSTIGAGTVLLPFGGSRQLTPEEGMAALIPATGTQVTDACSLMAYGFDPDLSAFSPYHGATYAVIESLARIAALGGDAARARLTFQEYFRRLVTPEDWGQPLSALLGAYRTQLACKTPAIGGKDSMSGSFRDLHVPPTLVSFAVGIGQAGRVLSAALDSPGRAVYLLPVPLDASRPDLELPDCHSFMNNLDCVRALNESESLSAAATVRRNGAAVACARMCFGNNLGFAFADQPLIDLFRPQPGALLLAVKNEKAAARLRHIGARLLGCTTREAVFTFGQETLSTLEALTAWEQTLEPVFPTRADLEQLEPVLPPQPKEEPREGREPKQPVRMAGMTWRQPRPAVFIPVFPGTNCEYDSARAFSLAGADPDLLVVRNNTPQAILETIDEMSRRIRKAQIVMLPGGFSAGDEPEGSGKFIAAVFRNPQLAEAVHDLLDRRDGLILGICNGFQALVKLGLLPYGRICDLDADSPTLTFNRIGRHMSRTVTTRVESVRSPWLQRCSIGDLHQVAVSHGEGRFVAPPDLIRQLGAGGQIATRYVGPNGLPGGLTECNPNGSMASIEGITSADGRIFGKMGHSERYGPHLMRNVPGEKDQHIFSAGVSWFTG
jgi:phosphoribosylformylglycinamidine synthase